MAALPRRVSDALNDISGREISIGRRRVPGRVERAAHQGAGIEYARGIVQFARIHAMESVARDALKATGRLSREEAFLARQSPHAIGRLQAIVDLAAVSMADMVAEMGRD